jgi:LAO/AO transport system kinase
MASEHSASTPTALPSPERLVAGIRAGDRALIAQAITLVESSAPHHQPLADTLIRAITPLAGRANRIGITGVPGAGKSTFIERFGLMRADVGARVAVLAIDPSSPRSGGSILGDKTRMEQLSRHPSCFVRPTPSRGSLGGIGRRTGEAITICEAAGFDTIIIETVGVGQSEIAVRSVSDFFILLCLTGAGDELQGFKKGVIELADLILVNKADGENELPARHLSADLNAILRYIPPSCPQWHPRALAISALTGSGLADAWDEISSGFAQLTASGYIDRQRADQIASTIKVLFHEEVERVVCSSSGTEALLESLTARVVQGEMTAREAVDGLMVHVGLK